jgi:group I intron endonuclease
MIAYLITNRINSKRYVGVSVVSLIQRWRCHLSAALVGNSQTALHRAIRKYGPSGFRCEQIACALGADELRAVEVALIRQFGSKLPNGYNMTDGGDGTAGRRVTKATKLKISAFNRGKVQSAATRAKLSAAHSGKRLSLAHRAKLSAAKLGRKMPPRTSLHRQRISAGLVRAHARRVASRG